MDRRKVSDLIVRSLLCCCLFMVNGLHAQTLDSLALANIGNRLVRAELEAGEGSRRAGDNCLRDTDGHYLSCYYAESSPAWCSDFNGDGLPDALFRFMDEGLGGGGNAYGFDYRIVLLDAKHQIAGQQTLFGGGKFSYGHLEVDKVSHGRIFATYTENPMSRSASEEDSELQSVSCIFSYRDGRIEEESYRRCPLAAMQKQIFRKDKGLRIESALALDDRFNEEYSELVLMPDSSAMKGMLSGCEDLELYFSRTIAYKKSLEGDKMAMKQALLDNLAFLKEQTVFKTLIGNVYGQLSTLNRELIKTEKYGGTAIHLVLPDRWKAHLFISGNEEQGSFITIRLERPAHAEVMDFWESMESRQRLK